MEQVKFLPLLIICIQTAKGFIWNSSTTSVSVCVGNTISLDWVYTLESGEILQVTSWIKSDGAGGLKPVADDFGGFTPAPAYVGRLTNIGNAGIAISNATSSDIGTYTVIVALTSGRIYRMNATVHVHEIANASCKPTCDSSWKCQIPQACPVQNYIAAVWTVDGVKHTNVFQCTPNNYNKPYSVCAEGDAVTLCYRGLSLCREEKPCIGVPIMDRMRNEDIRKALNQTETIVQKVHERQHQWLGHVIRMDKNRIANIVLHGREEGKAKVGHPRTTWMKSALARYDVEKQVIMRTAQDREE